MHFSPQDYFIYTGGEKGDIGKFDLRMMQMVEVSTQLYWHSLYPSMAPLLS